MVNYLEGILKISNVFLSLIAGFIALGLFKVSHKRKALNPWRLLIIALVLFAVLEIFGALRGFRIFESPFITHLIPTIMLGLLIAALAFQINVIKYTK